MHVQPSQNIAIVRDQTDAAGLPAANTHTAVLWKNGATTAESITRTNPTTGVYKFAWTIPADAAENDVFSLRVVDGDGYASTVWEGVVGVTVELDSASVAAIRDGIPKVGETHRYTQVDSGATTTDVSIGEAT